LDLIGEFVTWLVSVDPRRPVQAQALDLTAQVSNQLDAIGCGHSSTDL